MASPAGGCRMLRNRIPPAIRRPAVYREASRARAARWAICYTTSSAMSISWMSAPRRTTVSRAKGHSKTGGRSKTSKSIITGQPRRIPPISTARCISTFALATSAKSTNCLACMRGPCTQAMSAMRRCPVEQRPSRIKTALAKRARTRNRKVPLAKGNKTRRFQIDSHKRVVKKGITVPNHQQKTQQKQKDKQKQKKKKKNTEPNHQQKTKKATSSGLFCFQRVLISTACLLPDVYQQFIVTPLQQVPVKK